jgi:uncharacterized membrane protein YfcA
VILLDLSQQQAEATSLLAIIPVAIVGALVHDRHRNVRRQDGLLIGVLALPGCAGGVAVANAVSGSLLRVAFALLLLTVAAQLVREALRERPATSAEPAGHAPDPGP